MRIWIPVLIASTKVSGDAEKSAADGGRNDVRQGR
jgi:hypothetical protein